MTPPNSQTSSIEGVYPATGRTTHPFRVIEVDALSLQSITSLGRVGRILSGSDNGNCANYYNYTGWPFSPYIRM